MPSSSMLRGFDAFVRPKADVRNPSVTGGIITVIATTASVLLILAQFFCASVERHDALIMSASQHVPLIPLPSSNAKTTTNLITQTMGRVPLDFQITFPYLSCEQLDVSLDGSSYKMGELAKSTHGPVQISFRTSTSAEVKKATAGAGGAGTTSTAGGKTNHSNNKGCTVSGKLRPFVVAGVFAIGFHRQSWTDATTTLSLGMWAGGSGMTTLPDIGSKYNCTHYIHHLDFGTPPPTHHHQDHPLRNVLHAVQNDFHGIGIAYTQVKLVPTKVAGRTYGSHTTLQASVVDVTIQPQSMAGSTNYPGLVVSYDFTPLTIVVKDRDEDRGNLFLVLSSLVGILGGVFVTVQLLTGCLVHSAQEIAKKID